MPEHPSIDKLIGTTLGSYRLEQLLEGRSLAPWALFDVESNMYIV